jgi:hypothetical protein
MEQIQKYFSQNGITMEGIDIRTNEFGFFVQAEKDLKVGDIVARIPKESVLSVRNTAIADIIEEIEYGGVLGLCLAVMYEMSLRDKSPWHAYLQTIRAPLLPMCWDSNSISMLEGTDVGRAVVQDQEFVKEDFNELILPVVSRYPAIFEKEFFTIENWFKAHAIVSSRAFCVDDYHGESIVPLADLFNHHFDENVHFEIWNVCDECGAAEELCECNHRFGVDHVDDIMADDDEIPELEEDVECSQSVEEVDVSILEMVVVKPATKGTEVFNTYGKHSNASLLRLYGFLLHGNPHSTVTIAKDEVLAAIPNLPQNVVERIAYWDQVGKDFMEQVQDLEDERAPEEKGDCALDDCCTEDKSCCDVDGQCNLNKMDSEIEDEWEDAESDENEGEIVPDDFCFERNGPSYALLLFLNIMLLPNLEFEKIAADLEAAVKFFVDIRNVYHGLAHQKQQNFTSGKGKVKAPAPPVSATISRILLDIARKRMECYTPLDDVADRDENFGWASKLRDEEHTILFGIMDKFK